MRFQLILLFLCLPAVVLAQQTTPQPSAQEELPTGDSAVEEPDEPVMFSVTTVAKTTQAVNYRHRGGATKVNFAGTSLMPKAWGEAKVESKRGYIEIEVEFRELERPTKFGSEYLTYVMWAISPEGRAVNLGEVLIDQQGRAKLNVTTELQAFGLVVTAEPYFAVRMPSNLIVMENEIRSDTKGQIHVIDAKYELLERGQYEELANALGLTPDLKKFPLELYEARNAIQIARSSGADTYAEDILRKAEASLQQAETYAATRANRKQAAMLSRQAVQQAEDARALAVKRRHQEQIERERQEAAEREALAKAEAEEEARRRKEAEAQRKAEEERRARAEAEKANAERERMAAELAAARSAAEKAQAETARAEALLREESARRDTARARQEAERAEQMRQQAEQMRLQAEQEKLELRRKLFEQFSRVLETRDTERGLVVNMSDVLFDTGQYTLRPIAREKLARLAGIVISYPGLRLRAEGHTDNVGTAEFNQRLSEQRAEAVRNYLVSQGVPAEHITAMGFGFSNPVAPNDTSQGRQQNRRVEIVVSGEVIGTEIGTQASREAP